MSALVKQHKCQHHIPHTNGLTLSQTNRKLTIALAVVLLHAGFIWALLGGLMTPVVKVVIPVVMLSQIIEPPKPKEEKPPPQPAPPVRLAPPVTQVKKAIALSPQVAAPAPLAVADPAPTVNAIAGISTQPPAPATIAAPSATAPATAVAQPSVQLPSSNADYLQNPLPAYPSISRRLNEQGRTTVRVLIGADGKPQLAEIGKSSGFARLDDAAMATVMRWRFVPGKRGGVAETMWFNVPINWVLE